MPGDSETRYVISVVVSDRVGILRDITTSVTDLGANIDGISQTVMAGYFTVIITATFAVPVGGEKIRGAIAANFADSSAGIIVRPYAPTQARRRTAAAAEKYVITVHGTDAPGILKAVTCFLADKGINIEDWYVLFDLPHVTHIGEVSIPEKLDIKQFQDEFRQVLAGWQLAVSVQHENIFRATNKVGAIKLLLTENTHAAHR
jgi:predicted amino acid-binding ACT domain protein